MGFLYDFVLKNFWYKEDCSWRTLVFVDADPQDVILDERFLSVFHEASVGLGIFEWFLIGLWVAQRQALLALAGGWIEVGVGQGDCSS